MPVFALPTVETLQVKEGSFTLLHQKLAGARAAAVVLGGLDEQRAGHRYLLAQLAGALAGEGLSWARFDWAGQGDSTLPLELDTWRGQLEATLAFLGESYREVHVVVRGAGLAAVPVHGLPGELLAIRPPLPGDCELLSEGAEELSLNDAPSELWVGLGAEGRGSAGRAYSRRLVERLVDVDLPEHSLFARVEDVPSGAVAVDAETPLFLLERDRSNLCAAVTHLLETN